LRRITSQTKKVHKPFKEVIDVSSGDPHRAGMKPVSFVRQVSFVLLHVSVDIKVMEATPCTHLKSLLSCVIIVRLLASGEGEIQTGVLTPMPCPHTLPTLLDEGEVALVPYRLVEERGWAVDLDELHRAVTTARGRCQPRAIYISNPGNLTGHVQSRESIEEVIRFAAAEGLLLFVDEVYQDSRVLFEMGKEYAETVELVSSHSLSCSCIAECGQRAGYMEIVNMDPEVMHFLALDLMLNPPKPGDPSYDTHTQRALELLSDLPGISCQPAMGESTFIHMLEVEADVLYCQKLLEEEGVFVGAGHHETKNDRTTLTWHCMLHFLQKVFVLCLLSHRLCVLVPPDTMEEGLTRLCSFHLCLMDGHFDPD
uniref:alanine transaminase n=1 Tax=Amphiprion percula TaxID=161767 RepID=A0A3P8TQK8_AMPPE